MTTTATSYTINGHKYAAGDVLTGKDLMTYLWYRAKQLGLDPAAVLAVANVEGGFSQAVGDSGTSFGPFQLHKGGRLPTNISDPKSWANTPTGLNYALQGISSSGAKGKAGYASVSTIVTKFEKPANPSGEVTSAMGQYATYMKWATKAGSVKADIGNITAQDPISSAASAVAGAVGDTASAIGSIGSFFGALGKADTWKRVGKVLAGSIAIAYSIKMILDETNMPVPKAVSTVTTGTKNLLPAEVRQPVRQLNYRRRTEKSNVRRRERYGEEVEFARTKTKAREETKHRERESSEKRTYRREQARKRSAAKSGGAPAGARPYTLTPAD